MSDLELGGACPPSRPAIALLSALSRRCCESALCSYGLILAIQLKIIWQIWQYRDMTAGDTGAYFGKAFNWAEHLQTDVSRSPLYTTFFGTAYALTQDAYTATILHRAIIALLATLGVTAVARRMLPVAMAMLVGVWWAVLPINFDVYYEAHLFSFLPILAAWLFAMRADSGRSRGAALAMLVLTTFLLRYEYLVACLLYGLYCVWREIKTVKSDRKGGDSLFRSIAPSYLLPLTAVAALCLFFYWRTPLSLEQLESSLAAKHGLNMCQVYASGYGQRHPDWTASPWIDCDGLMMETFGSGRPTLTQMALNNFPALMDHFLWNLSLTPSGLQVALFDAASGQVNPDYTPRQLGESYPLWLGILAIGIAAAGLLLGVSGWRTVWSARFRPAAYRWPPLIAVAMTAVPIILTQRPRPEYLYPLTCVLMIVIGMSLAVITWRWLRALEICSLLVAIGVLLLVSPYYPAHAVGRPVKMAYDRLHPYKALLDALPGKIILGDYAGEMANWLGLSRSHETVLDYGAVPGGDPTTAFCSKVDCRKISAVFIHPRLLSQVEAMGTQHRFCPQDPDGRPWFAIGTMKENGNGLLLIRKTDDSSLVAKLSAVKCEALWAERPNPATELLPPAGIAGFPDGLMAKNLFFAGVDQDGWLGAKARTKLALTGPSNALHLVGSVPEFSQNGSRGMLTVTVDGVIVVQMPMTSGPFDRTIDIPEAAGVRTIRFEASETEQLPPDGRLVSIRLAAISLGHHD